MTNSEDGTFSNHDWDDLGFDMPIPKSPERKRQGEIIVYCDDVRGNPDGLEAGEIAEKLLWALRNQSELDVAQGLNECDIYLQVVEFLIRTLDERAMLHDRKISAAVTLHILDNLDLARALADRERS